MFALAPKKSGNTKYFDILVVSKGATFDELKKADRKSSIKNYLDKCGYLERVSYGCFLHLLV